uniref:Uncharacterized protein n=1 Tax=Chromera velia CCMP2878 TaxID=1169474 RepID=A0A0G4HZ89_9ALVE|eukprot:Cvel_9633.t1-p1 / transcript=Cvel_9633.t1 / gene=Cvel_9633 / organism=Chromera_velia_CCMP2878 / gene_product=hypothetical protein / transcript_product=hypothetical protein / location=Cvel_scaffold560:26020-29361(+) / protein_length=184 / sequence_SO=supercontig / SO=protein_coding / is_pseudo=false
MEERRARLKATYPTFGPGKDLGADPLTIHFRKSNKVEDLEPSFSPFDATYLKTGWGEAVGTSQLPSVTHRPYPPRRQCAPVTTGLSCPCGVQRTSPNFDFSKRCNHLLKANQPQSRNAFATARVTAEDGEKGPKYLSRKGITGYLGYPRTQAFKIVLVLFSPDRGSTCRPSCAHPYADLATRIR